MKINFLNQLSFLRCSGINIFITVDILPEYVKFACVETKEAFYRLRSGDLSGYTVLSEEIEIINGNFGLIPQKLELFIEKNKVLNPAVIAGINEYRFQCLSIPLDVDDVDLWFLEYSHKFLPEGRPKEEFVYSYEKYREDDNYKYYYVVVARTDFISTINDLFKSGKYQLLGIFPFPVLLGQAEKKGGNILFADFSSNRISYMFWDRNNYILSGDLYYNIYNSDILKLQNDYKPENINSENVRKSLEELFSILSNSAGMENATDIFIYYNAPSVLNNEISSGFESLFGSENINKKHGIGNTLFLSSFFALNGIFHNYDFTVNFINPKNESRTRASVEKQITMRYILSAGLIVLSLLLFLYITDSVLTGKVQDEQENFAAINAKITQIEKFTKDNSYIKANLSNLITLKDNKTKCSGLLAKLSEIIPQGCCLAELSIKEINTGVFSIEISGLSLSQQDVAETIKNMEECRNFKEVALSYTGTSSEPSPNNISGSLKKFNLNGKFYAD